MLRRGGGTLIPPGEAEAAAGGPRLPFPGSVSLSRCNHVTAEPACGGLSSVPHTRVPPKLRAQAYRDVGSWWLLKIARDEIIPISGVGPKSKGSARQKGEGLDMQEETGPRGRAGRPGGAQECWGPEEARSPRSCPQAALLLLLPSLPRGLGHTVPSER